MKQQNHEPLHISHESAYGDLSLMSDGDLIQLTGQLIDQKPSDAKAKPSAGCHRYVIGDAVNKH